MYKQFICEMSGQGDIKFTVVFVLGGPGAGKGTQCERIASLQVPSADRFQHLSAGELLRAERQRTGSEFGDLIEGHIQNGTIVPVEITCALLKRAMEVSGNKSFLIDGFPRNEDNLKGWEREMRDVAKVKFVLFFNCSDNVCIERCLNRGKTSGRSDDNKDSLLKRIQTYRNDTMPIIKYYEKKDLVKKINANQDMDKVFEDVRKLFVPC